jgi:MFS transporter (putative signal transducer)
LGRRRSWILACQAGVIAAVLIAGALPPASDLAPLLGVLFVIVLLAATQDIATDALGVEALTGGQRRLGGMAQVCGGYLGLMIGSGLWLPVYAVAGWTAAMLMLAVFIAAGTIPVWLARGVDRTASVAVDAPARLAAAWRNPLLRHGVLFILCYQLGGRLGVAMIGPFLVDTGLSLAEIGWLRGTGGTLVGLLAATLGGMALRSVSSTAALMGFGLLHAATLLGLGVAAASGVHDRMLLAGLCLAESASFALVFVALYTAMMGWCSTAQAGTDFALLQSADAALAVIAGAAAGQISQWFGHAANFTSAALILAVASTLGVRSIFRLPGVAIP